LKRILREQGRCPVLRWRLLNLQEVASIPVVAQTDRGNILRRRTIQRLHGTIEVVTGGYHEKGMSKGKPYEYRDRFTDVWMNGNGRWQLSLLTTVFQPANNEPAVHEPNR